MDNTVTQDFIFGTLGTDDRRVRHLMARSRGVWHGSRTEPRDPRPDDDVTFVATIGTDVSAARVELLLTDDGSTPTGGSTVHPMTKAGTTWDTLAWGYLEQWQVTIPAPAANALLRYRIRAVTPNGEVVWADVDTATGEPGDFAIAIDAEPVAPWLREAVIYQVFVDRFARPGQDDWDEQPTLMDIWGGTLNGVRERLPYLRQLGATVIWLSPIFPSPTHHGYDATDYTSIEPRLGTMEDFDALVAEAHGMGIKVLLDFVANHVSNEHPTFQSALADPESPEASLFTFFPDGGYDTFFGVESMPKVNLSHPHGVQWMTEAGVFWANRGVDGFRLDYCIGPPLSFWAQFRHALREVNPEFALIGEAVDAADALRGFTGRMDGVLDFLFLQQIRSWLGFDVESAEDFWRFTERQTAWFEDELLTPTFLDNHDMNRFLWVARGDKRKLKVAALVQMTLPQPPIVYYGTEVGLSQWHDLEYPDGSRKMEESRTPMLWGAAQDRDLLDFYRSLIFWRKKFRIARESPTLIHSDANGLLLYRIGAWLVAINATEDEQTVDLGSAGAWWLALGTENGVQLLGTQLVLPAMAGVVVANESAR